MARDDNLSPASGQCIRLCKQHSSVNVRPCYCGIVQHQSPVERRLMWPEAYGGTCQGVQSHYILFYAVISESTRLFVWIQSRQTLMLTPAEGNRELLLAPSSLAGRAAGYTIFCHWGYPECTQVRGEGGNASPMNSHPFATLHCVRFCGLVFRWGFRQGSTRALAP